MATSLDSILNTTIPIGVVIIFLGLIYWKLKEPIDMILKVIWKGIVTAFESIGSSLSGSSVTEVTYK